MTDVEENSKEIGYKRHIETNPYNYDNLTLELRDIQVRAAIDLYPSLPAHLIKMTWDFIHNQPKEEIDKIMNDSKH